MRHRGCNDIIAHMNVCTFIIATINIALNPLITPKRIALNHLVRQYSEDLFNFNNDSLKIHSISNQIPVQHPLNIEHA